MPAAATIRTIQAEPRNKTAPRTYARGGRDLQTPPGQQRQTPQEYACASSCALIPLRRQPQPPRVPQELLVAAVVTVPGEPEQQFRKLPGRFIRALCWTYRIVVT